MSTLQTQQTQALDAWMKFYEAAPAIVKANTAFWSTDTTAAGRRSRERKAAKAVAEWLAAGFGEEAVEHDDSRVWLHGTQVFDVTYTCSKVTKEMDLAAIQKAFFEKLNVYSRQEAGEEPAREVVKASSLSKKEQAALKKEANQAWKDFRANAPRVVEANVFHWKPPLTANSRRQACQKHALDVSNWLLQVFDPTEVELDDTSVLLYGKPAFGIAMSAKHVYRQLSLTYIKECFIRRFYLNRGVELDEESSEE